MGAAGKKLAKIYGVYIVIGRNERISRFCRGETFSSKHFPVRLPFSSCATGGSRARTFPTLATSSSGSKYGVESKYVQRLSEKRLPKQVLGQLCTPVRRRRGRAMKGWQQDVDKEMLRCRDSGDWHMWRLGVAKCAVGVTGKNTFKFVNIFGRGHMNYLLASVGFRSTEQFK